MACPFANYIVCHFGTIYMDGMTCEPPFSFKIFKGGLTMNSYERFDVGYSENIISILNVKFTNLVPFRRYLHGGYDW